MKLVVHVGRFLDLTHHFIGQLVDLLVLFDHAHSRQVFFHELLMFGLEFVEHLHEHLSEFFMTLALIIGEKVVFQLLFVKECHVIRNLVDFRNQNNDVFPSLVQSLKCLRAVNVSAIWQPIFFGLVKFFLSGFIELLPESLRVNVHGRLYFDIEVVHHMLHQFLKFAFECLLSLVLEIQLSI